MSNCVFFRLSCSLLKWRRKNQSLENKVFNKHDNGMRNTLSFCGFDTRMKLSSFIRFLYCSLHKYFTTTLYNILQIGFVSTVYR